MTETPLHAVERAFLAMERWDWKEFITVLDPAAIENFKQLQRFMLAMSEETGIAIPPSGVIGEVREDAQCAHVVFREFYPNAMDDEIVGLGGERLADARHGKVPCSIAIRFALAGCTASLS